MKTFKHSGTIGDIIYALPIIRHFGGGELYLHLFQINWVAYYYYNTAPPTLHNGKMDYKDFAFIESLLVKQPYITKFEVLAPHTDIDYNLDKFRPQFVTHPGNYVDVYANAFGIIDNDVKEKLRNDPWLTVSPKNLNGKKYVINRTIRYQPPSLSPVWQQWKNEGKENESIFVGLPEEYKAFCSVTGW